MIDIATLRAMAAAGASVDVILAAVEAAQKVEAERLSIKREKDAARQRRHRTARTSHAESQPVTRTECDTPPAYTTPPLSSKPKRVSRSVDSASLPTSCDEACREFAASKGWELTKIDAEWERFRNWGINKGKKHRDFVAAWRNWVTSPYQKTAENGNVQATQPQPGGAYGASKDRFREAFEELKAYNRRSDQGDGTIVEFLPAAGRDRA